MSEDLNCHTKNEKQKQVIIYAIDRYPTINRTKLMKLIFFIDLFYYNKFYDTDNKTRRTLLEDCYIRLSNGPVPHYGFEFTQPDENCEETNRELFTIKKITNSDNHKYYYYYQFKLKPGVSVDLSLSFKPVEIDLINLTLQTIMLRNASYFSALSHSYKLWMNSLNHAVISINDFELNDDEMENLETTLNTKIYLNPVNISSNKSNNTKKKEIHYASPNKLPVYYNAVTKEQIEI